MGAAVLSTAATVLTEWRSSDEGQLQANAGNTDAQASFRPSKNMYISYIILYLICVLLH